MILGSGQKQTGHIGGWWPDWQEPTKNSGKYFWIVGSNARRSRALELELKLEEIKGFEEVSDVMMRKVDLKMKIAGGQELNVKWTTF